MHGTQLKLSPKKCSLLQKQGEYLGHLVLAMCVSMDPNKVNATRDLPVRSFLGLCSYCSCFVKGFATIAKPLHELHENKQTFQWSKECDRAFRTLEIAMCSQPILACLASKGKYIVIDTDARNTGLGAVLSLVQNGEQVIAYYSKRPVSYTHLDVYKRQAMRNMPRLNI